MTAIRTPKKIVRVMMMSLERSVTCSGEMEEKVSLGIAVAR